MSEQVICPGASRCDNPTACQHGVPHEADKECVIEVGCFDSSDQQFLVSAPCQPVAKKE